MTQLPEVVITGVGLVCPIGIGKEAFAESLYAGRSGVGPITRFDATGLPAAIGAEIKEFAAKKYVKPRKSIKIMGREVQTAFAAGSLALADAGLADGDFDPDRTGVVLGAENFPTDYEDLAHAYRGCLNDGEFCFDEWGGQAMSQIPPLWMLKYLPNMPASHFAIAHDARGPNNSLSLGEVSSLLAVMEGAEIIRRGAADVMLVGGTSSRVTHACFLWRGDGHLSHRVDDPQAACRPFDADRDGMVGGEGAGALLLESREHAEKRNAAILGRLDGWASTYERPLEGLLISPSAIRRAIVAALRRADLEATDVGHVNAHGMSTVEHDRREAQAIREALGDVPVTAPKSFFGNIGAGGSIIELAASVLSFADGRVPFTLNYATPDPACPVNVIRDEPLSGTKPTALKVSYSRTGQAAALILSGV